MFLRPQSSPTGPSEFDREPVLPEDAFVDNALSGDRYFEELAAERTAAERGSSEEEPLLSRDDDPTPPLDAKPWYRRPSPWWILPGAFISLFNIGMIFAPLQMFMVTCICEEYFSSRVSVPGQNWTSVETDIPYQECLIPEISSMVSKFTIAYELCGSITALLTIGYWGKLSDRKGRRVLLCAFSLGSLAADIVLIIVALLRHQIGYNWLIVSQIISGIAGGRQLHVASSSAYVTDCTQPGQRSIIFGRLLAVTFLGIAVGPAIGSLIIKATGEFVDLLYLSLVIHGLWFLYIFFFIPESLTDQQREEARNKRPQSVLHHINIISAISVLFTAKTAHASKYSLPVLGALNFVVTLMFSGFSIIFLYTGLIFKWTAYENGIWMSFASTVRILILLAILPIFVRIFKKGMATSQPGSSSISVDPHAIKDHVVNDHRSDIVFDVWMLRVGYFLDMIAYIIFGLASVGWVMFVGSVVHAFSSISTSSAKALLASMSPPSQIGEVLAAVAIVDSVAGIVSPVILNLIYSATVATMPNLIFFFMGGLMLLATVLTFFIKPIDDKQGGVRIA